MRESWSFVVALLILVPTSSDCIAAERPNILWISAEDIGPHLGCYGYEQAVTPTLDRLAAEGVRYTRAFTTTPVCATNRSSIITGMYPTTIGTHYMRCEAWLPSHVRCFPEYLRAAGYYCTNNEKTDYNFPIPAEAWDECSSRAHWRGRKPGQPFFAVFNFTDSHESKVRLGDKDHRELTSDVRESERQDPSRLQPPPYYPDTPEVRREWANNFENITQIDHHVAAILAQLEEDGLADDTIVFFWSDHGVGLPRAKRFPYDSGLHVPLIVRIPDKLRSSDQGVPGTVNSELIGFVDLAPSVLNLAGVPIPAHKQGRAFLGPNLTAPRRYAFSVRDRMDERYDMIRSVRSDRYRYLRNYMPWKPYAQHISYAEQNRTMATLRRLADWGDLPPAARQFMSPRKPIEELYDLENDPHELTNLVDSTEEQHRAALGELRAALSNWEVDTGDLGLIPEPVVREREGILGNCMSIVSQGGTAATLARIRGVTSLEKSDAERRAWGRKAIQSTDPVERYWGVMCMTKRFAWDERPVDGLSTNDMDQLTTLLDDSEPVVRIAAAEALAETDHASRALDVLRQELGNNSPWVRLMAANALDELRPQDKRIVSSLERALDDEHEYVVRVAECALHRIDGRPLPNPWKDR